MHWHVRRCALDVGMVVVAAAVVMMALVLVLVLVLLVLLAPLMSLIMGAAPVPHLRLAALAAERRLALLGWRRLARLEPELGVELL